MISPTKAIALLGGVALLLSASDANAQYFENYAGQSYALTWLEIDSPIPSSDYTLMGYACFTRDTLEAMSATAVINRYEIRGDADYFYLHPISGATVYLENGSYVAEANEPMAEEEFAAYLETDDAGFWYIGDSEVSDFGRACVDGGIAGALNHLEFTHGIQIQR